VNGKARPRNAEWTKVGLLEAEPKPKPKPQTVKLDESSGGASESASSKPRRRKKRGSKGGSPQLSPSRSLPSLPSPPDGTGRPPLGMAPVEREPEPWSIAAERSSQEQEEEEEAKMLATDQAMKEFAYGTGMIDGSSAASAMSWGADEPAPEPELGYDGYPKGSSVRQGRVALEPPMPVLLQSRPPPPVPRLDLSSTFNSTFDAFKGSTLNSLDASMDLGEMGASRLMPSEIGRATMENAYRGKFPVGERGPFNGAEPQQPRALCCTSRSLAHCGVVPAQNLRKCRRWCGLISSAIRRRRAGWRSTASCGSGCARTTGSRRRRLWAVRPRCDGRRDRATGRT